MCLSEGIAWEGGTGSGDIIATIYPAYRNVFTIGLDLHSVGCEGMKQDNPRILYCKCHFLLNGTVKVMNCNWVALKTMKIWSIFRDF